MQLLLFDKVVIKQADLIADSKKNAFYRIRLEFSGGSYFVSKESGGNGKILDRRCWPQENFKKALKFYKRKLRDKLNPERNSKRKYQKAS